MGSEIASRTMRASAHAATSAMKLPSPTMTWKAMWTGATGGHSSLGKASRPLISAEVTDWVHFAPSERLEIVVDFSKYPIGTKLVMVNLLIDPANQKLFQIMRFNVMRAEPTVL